jgi:hypothetical protein
MIPCRNLSDKKWLCAFGPAWEMAARKPGSSKTRPSIPPPESVLSYPGRDTMEDVRKKAASDALRAKAQSVLRLRCDAQKS